MVKLSVSYLMSFPNAFIVICMPKIIEILFKCNIDYYDGCE